MTLRSVRETAPEPDTGHSLAAVYIDIGALWPFDGPMGKRPGGTLAGDAASRAREVRCGAHAASGRTAGRWVLYVNPYTFLLQGGILVRRRQPVRSARCATFASRTCCSDAINVLPSPSFHLFPGRSARVVCPLTRNGARHGIHPPRRPGNALPTRPGRKRSQCSSGSRPGHRMSGLLVGWAGQDEQQIRGRASW